MSTAPWQLSSHDSGLAVQQLRILLDGAGVKEAGWTPTDESPPPYRLKTDSRSAAREPTEAHIRCLAAVHR